MEITKKFAVNTKIDLKLFSNVIVDQYEHEIKIMVNKECSLDVFFSLSDHVKQFFNKSPTIACYYKCYFDLEKADSLIIPLITKALNINNKAITKIDYPNIYVQTSFHNSLAQEQVKQLQQWYKLTIICVKQKPLQNNSISKLITSTSLSSKTTNQENKVTPQNKHNLNYQYCYQSYLQAQSVKLATVNNRGELQIYFVKITNEIDKKNLLSLAKKFVKIASTSKFIFPSQITIIPLATLKTNAKPFIELVCHTKMTESDGVATLNDYDMAFLLKNIKKGAITDLNSVQNYPDTNFLNNSANPKFFYGIEMDLINIDNVAVQNYLFSNLDVKKLINGEYKYFVIDIETTGFDFYGGEIIEFCAMEIINNSLVNTHHFFIKNSVPIPEIITTLTGLTNEFLQNKGIEKRDGLEKIFAILDQQIVVAHNSEFDCNFIIAQLKKNLQKQIKLVQIDTLLLFKYLVPGQRRYRMMELCQYYQVSYDGKVKAHRADYDASCLYYSFLKMIEYIKNNFLTVFAKNVEFLIKNMHPIRVFIYAKNQDGIADIYELLTIASTRYLATYPRLPKFVLKEIKNRNNIIVGAHPISSDIWKKWYLLDDEQKHNLWTFYDFVFIATINNYNSLIDNGYINHVDQIKQQITEMVLFSIKNEFVVCVTSLAYEAFPWQKICRDVIIANKVTGNYPHYLWNWKQHKIIRHGGQLLDSSEICSLMSFLPEQNLHKIVFDNPLLISKQFQSIKNLFENKLFPPKFSILEKELINNVKQKMRIKYGKNPDSYIQKRFDYELQTLSEHKYLNIFVLAQKVVEQAHQNGMVVGSRGSVGGSLIAYLANITEINPLPPHYYCKKCTRVEWQPHVMSGYNLKPTTCKQCEAKITGDGQNVLFETFLGIDGNKIPDIDLNFASSFQETIHDYTKDLVGQEFTIRVGTISTLSDRASYAYVKTFLEKKIVPVNNERLFIEFIIEMIKGIKRTTGQHPGGLIIFPKDITITKYLPICYPANRVGKWKISHYPYDIIHNNFLKLDLLGHVDPEAIMMLEKLTNVKCQTIPNYDSHVMSIFSTTAALNCEPWYTFMTGALGIPEFGTIGTQRISKKVKPTVFSDLIAISGLSHGTNVWSNNGEKLLAQGKNVSQLITCRDDIMLFLQKNNINTLKAFEIMEQVRRGRGLTSEQKTLLLNCNIPSWYIASCQQIEYIFPKAHAIAYVYMAWRIAWFKVYYPCEFYATFLSLRCSFFDIESALKGHISVTTAIKNLSGKRRLWSQQKIKGLTNFYDIVLEMLARKIQFAAFNIKLSHPTNFVIDKNKKKIIPAWSSLDGLGTVVATKIWNYRDKIQNLPDLQTHTGANKRVMELLSRINLEF